MKPTLYYFPIRGRGEPIRLILAAAGVDYEELPIDYAAMKADAEAYPCGQVPRYKDETVDMVQSNAIIRYLGRKYDMYGSDIVEQAFIDQVLDVVEAIKVKYLSLIYVDQLSDEAKAAYWKTHFDASSARERNSGAHAAFLDCYLKRNGGKTNFLGDKLSVADIAMMEIVELHYRIYGDELKAAWPALIAHLEAVSAVPGIAAYITSDRRLAKVNNNNLG